MAMCQRSSVYYLYGDHLPLAGVLRCAPRGSTSLITNASGTTLTETRYEPYGQPYWQWGATRTDFGFTGQRLDGFGLMDYNARYYSSTLGRFVSPDSIIPQPGNPMAWDRFAYVRFSPTRLIDPTGNMYMDKDTSLAGITKDDLFNSLPTISIGEVQNPEGLDQAFISSTITQYNRTRRSLWERYGWRYIDISGKVSDEIIMALLIDSEFGLYKQMDDNAYGEALEALSNEYSSGIKIGKVIPGGALCYSQCTLNSQISWLLDMQGFRSESVALSLENEGWKGYYSDAMSAKVGYQYGAENSSWFWGNVTEEEKMSYSVVYETTVQFVQGKKYFIVHR